MREVFTMWRHTKMVVLVALTAAVYAAILIPLKGIPLIPGITELRPANVVPVVFSILFGPAAAWGSAFGNLIGDFFGTLGLGSIFGFVGNFFYGLVAYKLCGKMGPLSSRESMEARTGRQIVEYLLLAFLVYAVGLGRPRSWSRSALLGLLLALSFWNWSGSAMYLMVLAAHVAALHLISPSGDPAPGRAAAELARGAGCAAAC